MVNILSWSAKFLQEWDGPCSHLLVQFNVDSADLYSELKHLVTAFDPYALGTELTKKDDILSSERTFYTSLVPHFKDYLLFCPIITER